MIDAHQHFWQTDRGDYGWMDDSVAPIRRDFLPGDLERIAPALGITGTVVVQAAPTVAETEFLLSLARGSEMILGVVGWAALESPDLGAELDRLATNPVLKGLRPMLQDIPDTGWLLRAEVVRGLDMMADAGLSLDALIQPRHLGVIDTLARRLPHLPIVIDHCAKPVFGPDTPPDSAWRDGIARLAGHPQIMCKLSGLANECGPGWSAAALAPVAAHVLDVFGPERVMWGSDWPVLELAGDCSAWLACAQSLTAGLDAAGRAAVFGGTAQRFYRLSPRP
ncbi:amidohydrolase [Paroceanicella profunda]|uniref:Amidohydrolase n=1 Tax=Paroceanicella profunda TaxID=2579971 RepID=A0A5B8FYE1_9RHOB|nr:amidohydrolase family protein [Paroceanicella profunda]QDL91649.1 amidohydrolase [Paroceanicella profunda]